MTRHAPCHEPEDEKRCQQRDDDPPGLWSRRAGSELEGANDLATTRNRDVRGPVLEHDASRPRVTPGEYVRVAPHADVEAGRIAKLGNVGIRRSGIVP